MKIPIVGDSYQAWSIPFNSERTINLFPVLDQKGRDVNALYGTPGLSLFANIGTGLQRGCFKSRKNGRVFFISAQQLYEVDSSGTGTNRGSLNQSYGNVTITENETQMAICDGVTVYIFTYSSNNFAEVSSPPWSAAGTITTISNYFIINEVGTGKYYISTVGDGTTWASLEFKSAESSPDKLLRVLNGSGLLWGFGEVTTEIFSDTGASNFPFQKVSDAEFAIGILAPYTAISINRSIIWLGQNAYGRGSVYEATNIAPNKISTEAIDLLIENASSPEDIVAWVYQEKGHIFYVLTGGGLETSLVYDLTTRLWHERAYLNEGGDFELHRGNCAVFAFGKHLIGDRVTGNIYEMSMSYYSDNGDPLVRERITSHFFNEGDRLRYNALQIGVETGVGNTNDPGQDPKMTLSLSSDGGHTYKSSYTETIGKKGTYFDTINFRRLGITDMMTFKLRIASAVKVAIFGGYLKNLNGERSQ